MEERTIIDQVADHLSRYEALARLAGDTSNPDDILLLLSDINEAFRSTLDRLAA